MKRLLVILVLAWTPGVFAGTDVFMHPHGDDSSTSATSPSTPLRSLSGVHNYIRRNGIIGEINVCIAPGYYEGQRVQWSYYSPDGYITFKPSNLCGQLVVPAADKYSLLPKPLRPEGIMQRPVFDGTGTTPTNNCWSGGAWFYASNPKRLRFFGLRIQNYQLAIYLRGDENGSANYGENVIEHMIFDRIGTVWAPLFGNSPAAVDVVRSSGNVIRNNEFVRIENLSEPGRCGNDSGTDQDIHIHAIYVAHDSNGNQIVENDIAFVTGAPIKFRGQSDNALITGNTIAWSGPYRDNAGGPYAAVLDRPESGELVSCGQLIDENSIGPGYYESASSSPVATFKGDSSWYGLRCTNRGIAPARVTDSVGLTGLALRRWYASLEAVDCTDNEYPCPPPPPPEDNQDPFECGGDSGVVCP